MKNVFYIFTLIGLTLLPSTKALSLDESILISQTKTNAHDVKIPPYLPLSGKASAAFSRNQGNVDEGALKYSFSLSSQGEANKVYLKIKGKRTEKRQKRSKEEHEMSLLNVYYHLNHTSGFYGKVTSYHIYIPGIKAIMKNISKPGWATKIGLMITPRVLTVIKIIYYWVVALNIPSWKTSLFLWNSITVQIILIEMIMKQRVCYHLPSMLINPLTLK